MEENCKKAKRSVVIEWIRKWWTYPNYREAELLIRLYLKYQNTIWRISLKCKMTYLLKVGVRQNNLVKFKDFLFKNEFHSNFDL